MAQPASPCAGPGKNVRVSWRGAGAGGARLYFRSDNAKAEHYLDMRRTPDGFFAVLPRVASALSIAYRIVTTDAGGKLITRSSAVVPVLADCATPDLRGADQAFGRSLVVGLTEDGPTIPVGFGCEGIIGRISGDGQLSAYDACSMMATAAVGITRSSFPNQTITRTNEQSGTDAADLGVGVIRPDHHRRPRRAPIPPRAPNPRLVEPVSPSRP